MSDSSERDGFVAPSTRARGSAAEDRAAQYLEARGFDILERNVTLAGAEIDLIARSHTAEGSGGDDVLLIVEVRSRAIGAFGDPSETVSRHKQAHIVRAAKAWLVKHDLWEKIAVRFDVIAIVGTLADAHIEWIENAYQVE